ncbi:putative Carboxy-terminal domain RNA polymerase II polypeptide A small phosphatase [Tripterygium wilfordii]|uniref:Putative Carboxy-terminal domain RNA polymerase II polypeptide A small phosphatase n=1 Tax=Tripterygium wilfordii TaxID=458696 RepID=A0A7J7CVY1_TRIWF|nr:CTD small phosphatase-like protein [Tripterygium wilfordii]KAF5738282.1 putative Carboxy-terminal domain RNA polymerase II polypeptide A small phosphatase [Tripterygium wilfordii]
MVSKLIRKSLKKAGRDRRIPHRHRRRSPAKTASPRTLIFAINKSIHSGERRLAKFFCKLARIATPICRKGYKILPRQESEPEDSICKVLFCNDYVLPPSISPNKRTVFLDLDETLVHSNRDPPPNQFDFVVRPKIDGNLMNFYVLKRPGLDEFLEFLNGKFEVVVFTAGLKEYASLVLDRIDKKGVISHRLYRDSCKEVDGRFVKDLSATGRELNRVVIVDDNPNACAFQPENAIQIRPFIDDQRDEELMRLVKFFEGCDCFDDMRHAVKAFGGEHESHDLKLLY